MFGHSYKVVEGLRRVKNGLGIIFGLFPILLSFFKKCIPFYSFFYVYVRIRERSQGVSKRGAGPGREDPIFENFSKYKNFSLILEI